MGGEGAKERRRLMRLNQRNDESKKSPEVKPKFDKKSKALTKPSVNRKRKNFSNDSATHGKQNQHQQGLQNPKKKNAKKKKPKHLKRKLEQLAENDSETREELLKEMADFERKKQEFNLHKKRPKVDKESPKNNENPSDTDTAGEENQKEDIFEEKSRPVIQEDKIKKGAPKVEGASDKISKDDSDSDSDDDNAIEQRRQRGRRRRGRMDTSKEIKKSSEAETGNKETRKREMIAQVENSAAKKETNGKRYCIGRKALTDYSIGKTYTGKVVYVKPWGIFIDIGCHSDAFCHVSRLNDDYIESPDTHFKEGDIVDSRVIEIDRRKKRITVSLQSEARMEDERASMKARQKRKDSRKSASSSKRPRSAHSAYDAAKETPASKQSFVEKVIEQPMPVVIAAKRTFQPPDESTMTPAELKRSRKLARRAARREQAENSGESTQ